MVATGQKTGVTVSKIQKNKWQNSQKINNGGKKLSISFANDKNQVRQE